LIVSAWRIVKQKHSRNAFSGEGARRFGGRWNTPGVSMVYLAQSQALAALEMLVHLDAAELLRSYVIIEVGIDECFISRVDRARLGRNWRSDPPPAKLRAIGDAWIAGESSVVLQVPSVLVPAEFNYLVNPRHADFPELRVGKPSRFRFDPRLTGK
jgi:RES domain-containing protein